MSKLLKYYVALNREDVNAPLIFQTDPPYVVGKIWTFKDEIEFTQFINGGYQGLAIRGIDGYKICISFYDCLSGKLRVVDPNISTQLESIIKEMVDFYRKERVEAKPGLYLKFKL